MLTIIVAIDQRNAIGRNNDIPWHISSDLKRFKALTMGHTVIMGKNTWDSLPFKPLKGRRNIVISKSMAEREDCEVVRSVEKAVQMVKEEDEAFIMGGAGIYEQMFAFADKLMVTHIRTTVDDADRFFPTIKEDEWKVESKEGIMHDDASNLEYEYVTYKKR